MRASWPEDVSVRSVWENTFRCDRGLKGSEGLGSNPNLSPPNEQRLHPPPPASLTRAVITETFWSTPRHTAIPPSPRSSNQKQKMERMPVGGWGGLTDSRGALIIVSPPHTPLATWSVSCYELTRDESWLHHSRAKPNTLLLQLVVLNQTHTAASHKPLAIKKNLQPTTLVNYCEDLLDIMGIQISCIFTAYEKLHKILTMMGHQNFTHVQSPKKGNAGMMGKLKVFIVWGTEAKLQ